VLVWGVSISCIQFQCCPLQSELRPNVAILVLWGLSNNSSFHCCPLQFELEAGVAIGIVLCVLYFAFVYARVSSTGRCCCRRRCRRCLLTAALISMPYLRLRPFVPPPPPRFPHPQSAAGHT
jgi:hypothetical protein